MAATTRLDVALTQRGLARSRSHAQQLITSGNVLVSGEIASKHSQQVSSDTRIRLLSADNYVSRGAYKLLHALAQFDISVAQKLCLDVGASTGGFTQVLLEHGAAQVIALDVGHSQLAAQLVEDSRVRVVEGFNARALTPAALADVSGVDAPIQLVVGDLSFISLRHIFAPVRSVIAPDATVVFLIKPQFEVGPGLVKSGIVTDPSQRKKAIEMVIAAAADAGFGTIDITSSPISGSGGNIEYLGLWRLGEATAQTVLAAKIADLVAE